MTENQNLAQELEAMDIDDFVTELATLRERGYRFVLTQRGYVRSLHNPAGMQLCPITAVAHANLGMSVLVDDVHLAAEAINLPQRAFHLILDAVDNERVAMRQLRPRLLAACGLAEGDENEAGQRLRK